MEDFVEGLMEDFVEGLMEDFVEGLMEDLRKPNKSPSLNRAYLLPYVYRQYNSLGISGLTKAVFCQIILYDLFMTDNIMCSTANTFKHQSGQLFY